jgi:hypothetical protein
MCADCFSTSEHGNHTDEERTSRGFDYCEWGAEEAILNHATCDTHKDLNSGAESGTEPGTDNLENIRKDVGRSSKMIIVKCSFFGNEVYSSIIITVINLAREREKEKDRGVVDTLRAFNHLQFCTLNLEVSKLNIRLLGLGKTSRRSPPQRTQTPQPCYCMDMAGERRPTSEREKETRTE